MRTYGRQHKGGLLRPYLQIKAMKPEKTTREGKHEAVNDVDLCLAILRPLRLIGFINEAWNTKEVHNGADSK